MSDRIVSIACTSNIVLATLWHDVLTDAGIEAELGGADMSTAVYPGMPSIAGIDLFVKEEDAPRARELIAAAEREAEAGDLSEAAEREAGGGGPGEADEGRDDEA